MRLLLWRGNSSLGAAGNLQGQTPSAAVAARPQLLQPLICPRGASGIILLAGAPEATSQSLSQHGAAVQNVQDIVNGHRWT